MDKDRVRRVDLVRTLVPINGLSARYQDQLIKEAQAVPYKRGKVVFKEGDRDDFTFYLLEGELEMFHEGSLVKLIAAGSDAARYSLAQLQPRHYTAKAKTEVTVLRVDRSLLDKLLTLEEQGSEAAQVEVAEIESEESVDWMTRMLQSELFQRIPAANIQKIFAHMRSVPVRSGQVVARQGEPGDYYYVVCRGRCAVSRRASRGSQEIRLAELHEGDSFGEEALVSEAKRNASVTMLADGELMRLTKEDFVELIQKPALKAVTYEDGQRLAQQGAVWLDVRFPDEHKASAIEGSINLPLSLLRIHVEKLERNKSYIVYCDSGSRSSAGAFLLTEVGFDALYLAGGLLRSPLGQELEDKTEATKSMASARRVAEHTRPAASKTHTSAAKPEPAPAKRGDPAAGQDSLEVDVRAAALNAELAKVDVAVEDARRRKDQAEKAKQTVEHRVKTEHKKLEAETAEASRVLAKAQQVQEKAKAAKRAAQDPAGDPRAAERQQLEAEAARASQALTEAQRLKEETEAAKRKAEAEVERRRKEEEQRIERLKAEVEERLRKEQQKLQGEYSRNAEELAEMQRLKEEAERKAAEERQRLEAEAADARERLEEARRLQKEVERARREQEDEGVRRKAEQESREKALREEVEAKLRDERGKLEAEFAKSAEILQRAQREKLSAEAAREAAAKEAERIIAEYKAEHDKQMQEEQARLGAEREKLDAEAQRTRQSLVDAQRAREEAQAANRDAQAEAARLRAGQVDTSDAVSDGRHIHERIAAAESNLDQTRRDLEAAEQAQAAAVAAEQAHAERFERQRQVHDGVRNQLMEEMEQWREEQDRKEQAVAGDVLREHRDEDVDRIRQKAEEAKRGAVEDLEDLLADVKAQLKDT